MADTVLGEIFFKDGVCALIKQAIHNGRISSHQHDFCEFVYISDGFTLHSVSGMVNILMTGDIFFILPGEEHSYINAYQTKIYNIIFRTDELEAFADELASLPGISGLFAQESGIDSIGKRILHVPMQLRRSVESTCEKMAGECSQQKSGWKCALRARLASFLVQYSRMHEAQWEERVPASGDYYGYIYKIFAYVDQNYAAPISMADLSDVTGLSPDYMTRKFRLALNMTPSEYVRKFRIARAMELLCTTDLPVSDIAKRTGFSDVSLFSRVFKQSAGLSPALYRRHADD